MIQLLEENWQHLLGIFRKFSLKWWKRRQLRSWIAFGKCIRAPLISLTRNGSRTDLSVTSINTEELTPIKYISGMEMGETVTFVGVVSREGQC